MKKTFPLQVTGKDDQRVLQAIKLELTKYVKRERRKTLPPDVDFWHFNCKVGSDSETAVFTPLPDVPRSVETVAQSGALEVYVEILATPGFREKRSSSGQYQRQDR
jgi:Family of unknown function (DUF6172)